MTDRGEAGRRLRIGVIAPDLFDRPGGMPDFARRLAGGLAATDDVTVYAPRSMRRNGDGWHCEPILDRDLSRDAPALAAARPDVWFACNFALAAVAPQLAAPLVVYCNGNDVLNPWLTFRHPHVERLAEARYFWRLHEPARRWIRRRDIRRGLARTASLIANSTGTEALVRREYPATDGRTTVIPPGVGEEFFQEPVPARDGTLRLLTVSRLEAWTARKNVDGVLRALTLLPPDVAFRYTIVGDGDDRPRLEALCDELGLRDRVRFAGSVDAEGLRSAYRHADLFIMASRARPNDVEGFGIVYLEAAAAGVPSIASRAGGATDAVHDGETGIVLDGAEPADIAAGIHRFLRERDRLAPDRIRRFADRFRWPAVARRFRAHLAGAAATASARRTT